MRAKNTSRPQRYLRKHGYTGTIIPVNPGRDEIFGEKAYPDLVSIPDASITRSSWFRRTRSSRDRAVRREERSGCDDLQ
jgi:predicted CoA-binding protein